MVEMQTEHGVRNTRTERSLRRSTVKATEHWATGCDFACWSQRPKVWDGRTEKRHKAERCERSGACEYCSKVTPTQARKRGRCGMTVSDTMSLDAAVGRRPHCQFKPSHFRLCIYIKCCWFRMGRGQPGRARVVVLVGFIQLAAPPWVRFPFPEHIYPGMIPCEFADGNGKGCRFKGPKLDGSGVEVCSLPLLLPVTLIANNRRSYTGEF